MDCRSDARERGFTLIELSIVLIIIGLIAGSVLVGRDLMRAAELRSVLTDVDRYVVAAHAFRLKYNALPGDMRDAETYWGSDVMCPNTPATPGNMITKSATCNGNGDGIIGHNACADIPPVNDIHEAFRFWQQLANAGLISGGYSGVAGGGSPIQAIIGVNVPSSRMSGGGFTFQHFDCTDGDIWHFPTDYGHILDFGAPHPLYSTSNPILSPTEARSLDNKVDDAAPATGRVITNRRSFLPDCVTSDDPAIATYNTLFAGVACGLKFIHVL